MKLAELSHAKPRLLLILFSFSLCLAGQGQYQRVPGKALPPAPGRVISTLTQAPGYFSEPSIAVNPRNPQQVVAVFQSKAYAAYSEDGGKSWKMSGPVAPANYKVSGDVSVAFDSRGQAILCYIAFDKLGTFNYWGHNASRNGVFIRRSFDGGKVWEPNQIPVAEQPTRPSVPFEDKPYLVADTGSSKYGGNLYVGWTRWTLTNSQMLFARSTDGGETWSPPLEIDPHPGLPRDDNGALEGFEGAVAPDGTLYSVWSDGHALLLTASHDGGQHFSRPRAIIHTAPAMFAIQDVERANGFPQIAVDGHHGHNGRVYITWSDYRNGDLDVFCSASDNRGRTWSQPIRVNNDPLHDGADQYFQWMAVDPIDGSVNVIFFDRRDDPKNRTQIVALARSQDAGKTFQNYAWTTDPFDPGGAFIGDYNGIAAFNGRVFGAWTERPARKDQPAPTNTAHESRSHDTIVRVGFANFGKSPQP